jgi:hypothetical protein
VWVQIISVQVRPGENIDRVIATLKAGEQSESGLIREMFLQDQKDPERFTIVAMFETEEQARAREADPRRAGTSATMRTIMGEILAAPPQFIDLTVIEDWTP